MISRLYNTFLSKNIISIRLPIILKDHSYSIPIFLTTTFPIPKEQCSVEYLFQGHETESEGEDFILLTERHQINHPRNNEPNVFITTTTGHTNAFFG